MPTETTVAAYLTDMLTDAEVASRRAATFVEQLCAGDHRLDLLVEAPAELGAATDALLALAEDLRVLLDEVLKHG